MNNPYGHYRRHNTPAAEHMAALWKEVAREHVARSSSARQHARDCHDSMDAAIRRANKAEFDAATYRADRDAAEEERDEAARERDFMRAVLVHANKAIARLRADPMRAVPKGTPMTTDDQKLTERIRDEVAGIVIGSGYYATAIGIDEAGEVAAAVLPIIREAQADAWGEGHSWGWSDAQEAHDMRQVMPRSEWRLCAPNPYRTEQANG